MRELNIDIETYSTEQLTGNKSVGVYKYSECPDFDVLLFGYSFDNDPVRVIDLISGDRLPQEVLDALQDPSVLKTAHNANFELVCLNKYLPMVYGITTPVEQWECTMVKCAMMGLPLSLDAVGKVLDIESKKDAGGKALIRYFSVPCKPTKTNEQRTRNYPFHDAEKWQQYIEYNRRDVEAEKEIRKRIKFFEIPPFEKKLWYQDQLINNTGVRVDLKVAENAVKIYQQVSEDFKNRVALLTGVDNPNSDAQIKGWLKEQGVPMNSLAAEAVEEAVNDEAFPPLPKKVLKLRSQYKLSSISKYEALLRALCADERVRGIIQFYGAARTGRYAGRIFQPQNLPRIELGDTLLDAAREFVRSNDIEGIKFTFGDVAEVLKQLIRTAIVPADGKVFLISDFSAIEARIIAWLADENWRMDVFNTHGKIYEASASKMFGVDIGLCGKGTDYRQRGKVAELALGYQGAAGALIQMGALKMGINIKELRPLVKAWRKENANIVQLWYDLEEKIIECVKTGERVELPKGMSAEIRKGILFIKLPSGRELSYYNPSLTLMRYQKVKFVEEYNEYEEGDTTLLPYKRAALHRDKGRVVFVGQSTTKHSLVYKGLNDKNQWVNVHTYGGKLTENIVQAIARDCLVFAKYNLYERGYFTVMHVHDEVVIESEPEFSSTEEVDKIMSMRPSWGKTIPLTAESYISRYYKKD